MQVAAGCCDRRQTTSKIRSFSPIVRGLLATGTLTALLLAGCGSTTRVLASADAAGSLSGSVRSAGQPVGNAQVQLYAAGDATGTANPPLLKQPVITDSTGAFKVLETYTCPSPAAQLYLVATGGSVTAHAASSNNASTLIAALGSCDDLSASTAVEANELTTAAAVAALAPFMPSVSTLGAPATEQQALAMPSSPRQISPKPSSRSTQTPPSRRPSSPPSRSSPPSPTSSRPAPPPPAALPATAPPAEPSSPTPSPHTTQPRRSWPSSPTPPATSQPSSRSAPPPPPFTPRSPPPRRTGASRSAQPHPSPPRPRSPAPTPTPRPSPSPTPPPAPASSTPWTVSGGRTPRPSCFPPQKPFRPWLSPAWSATPPSPVTP